MNSRVIQNVHDFYGRVEWTSFHFFSMQYFADRDIFCSGRVAEEDLLRVAAASGGTVQTTVNNVIDDVVRFLVFINIQFD